MDGGFSYALLGLFVGLIYGFLWGWILSEDRYRAKAIERGFALYCPDSGDFAWKDECDAD